MSRKAAALSSLALHRRLETQAQQTPRTAAGLARPAQPKQPAWHPQRRSGYTLRFSAERHIGTALRETYRAFARALVHRLAPLGLTLNMWFALRSLWEDDGLSQAQLARRIELKPAAMVAVLNALEAAGLVERRRSRSDRRIHRIFLTGAGRRLRTKATALALQVDARALRGTDHLEIAQALDLLNRLRRNLANTDAPAND
ncbi:MAG: MarR family transcriptional regulator [Hyphomicrobiales bacterium]|nr:MarR family transcriptional regulator [Hyphomicrobiales bacterium]